MKNFFPLFAAVAATAIAASASAETVNFTRNGEAYTADVFQNDGLTVITGRNLTSNQQFALQVRGAYVTGSYSGQTVSFKIKDKSGLNLASN